MISNAHIHTQFCDGKSTAEELVLAAIGRGLEAIGFSSHGVQNFDLPYCMTEQSELDYKREVARLKEKYADKIRIWLGVERDVFSKSDPSGYDYWILSAHYAYCDGGFAPVNKPDEVFAISGDRTNMQIVDDYYLALEEAAKLSPSFIGHIDFIKRMAEGGAFDPKAEWFLSRIRTAMERIIPYCRVIELNTSMITRRGVEFSYPCAELLAFWRSIGGEVIITTDCHDARWLEAGYDEGVEILRRAGYDKMIVLGKDALLEKMDL